jgi:hypothetical protein
MADLDLKAVILDAGSGSVSEKPEPKALLKIELLRQGWLTWCAPKLQGQLEKLDLSFYAIYINLDSVIAAHFRQYILLKLYLFIDQWAFDNHHQASFERVNFTAK